ncbi:hypothetical protein BU26DRAFT_232824 [Trematosphaeria pertusa]|uniref:Uncharacterized protein n=1 Tax=Trematosphaeria pertusa TaxID=390896 RepID=A0A6A6IWH7_9PLEO|nr:uncharacterized protein BU26DRAFT_232824 [Trematosphaeria pertusa]KAF2253970.1 hypothetical protein BU26DRAFT_232824 [Trematosphaeria pertusa]
MTSLKHSTVLVNGSPLLGSFPCPTAFALIYMREEPCQGERIRQALVQVHVVLFALDSMWLRILLTPGWYLFSYQRNWTADTEIDDLMMVAHSASSHSAPSTPASPTRLQTTPPEARPYQWHANCAIIFILYQENITYLERILARGPKSILLYRVFLCHSPQAKGICV